MSDKNIKLTRRRALGALGVVGVASAGAGAGTLALFSDEETSGGNSVQAGTLDLTLDGGNEAVTLIDTADVKPGDNGDGRTTLTNDGSVDGYVDLSVTSVYDPENGVGEAEMSADSTGASRGTFDLEFSQSSDVADAGPASPGWVPDRVEPTSWEISNFDGDDRLRIEIGDQGSAEGFNSYIGKKYIPGTDLGQWNAGDGTRLSYRFYVDSAWESDGDAHETGVWIVGGDADTSGNVNADRTDYSILHYQDSTASDSGSARFRYFDGAGPDTGWSDVGLPSGFDPTQGGWVDVDYVFNRDGDEHRWYVNGELFHVDGSVGSGTDVIYRPIVNSVNFDNAKTKEYYYDDLTLETPGDGELDDALEFRAYFDDGSTTYVVGGPSTYVPFSSAVSPDLTYDADYLLGSQQEADFVVEWRIPESVGNEIQSDGLTVDFAFELGQETSQ